MSARFRSVFVPYGIAVVSVAVAILVRLLFDPVLGDQLPFATLFFAVVVTALAGGLRPALAAVALGGLVAYFVLLAPRFSFSVPSADQQFGLAFFVLNGLGISLLGGYMHEARRMALESARSNRRQAALIDQTFDAVIVWDWSGPITYWNRGAERLYGYTREEAMGKAIRELLNTPAADSSMDFAEALERDGEWEGELLHTRRDSQVIDVESRMVLIREAGAAYVLETVRNITERKRIERELRLANERLEERVRERTAELAGTAESLRVERDSFAKIVSAVPGVIYLFRMAPDGAWSFPFANSRLEEIYGFPMDVLEKDATPLFACIHPADVRRVRDSIIESARGNTPWKEAFRFRHATRGEIWIDGHSIPTTEPDGSVVWHGYVADDTERRRIEEALRVSESRLKLSQRVARLGTFDLNLETDQTLWSPEIAVLYGTASDEETITKSNWMSLIHPDDHQEVERWLDRALETGLPTESEWRILWSDGTVHWIAGRIRVVNDEAGHPVRLTGVNLDVTARKRADLRLQTLNSVNRILATYASSTEAGEQIVESLCHSLRWKRGEFWSADAADQSLERRCEWPPSSIGGSIPTGKESALARRVMDSGQVVWIRDLATDPEIKSAEGIPPEGIRSAVGFPLTLGNELLGAVVLFRDEATDPDDDMLSLLTAVGSQFGQFIERTRAGDRLRESEERFRQIAEGISEVFWLSDPVNKSVLYVSPAFESIWGRTSESLGVSPAGLFEYVHPDDLSRVKQAAENPEASGEYDLEYRIVRPDGSIRWIHDRGFLIRDAAGAVYRVGGVAEDVTERRMAEEASLHQQRRLAGIVDSAMDGIVTIDEDHRVLLVNAAAERMFGCQADEVIGQSVEHLMPERSRSQHAEHVREFGRTGVAARSMGSFGPILGLRADGSEFPIEAAISQIEVDGRKLFTVTCRDTSERAQAAEANRVLEAQLHQSQKMEAFGQLAGGVAHDFNNLITIIDGYSDLMLRTLPPESSDRSYVLEIRQAGLRAATLTRQLLAFSRQQVLEPRILDLNEVVTDTEKMLRRLIGEDIRFEILLRPGIATVRLDPGQIVQVIMNLVVNARDAMPTGGDLRIETAEVEIGEEVITAHADAGAGTHVMIAISDTGVGMPPDVAERIFEPFFTTKGVGKGTGLGLAVVDGIVRQSGGFIDMKSEPGVGTTFEVYFPAVLRPAERSEEPEPARSPRGPETVLLVEDEESVRQLAALALRDFGYRVLTASGGKEALRLMADNSSDVRILVTDVVMPEMSGREIAESLVATYPALKVLFVSGYTDDAVVLHGVQHSNVAFLRKPFTPSTLAAKVREVLDSD